MLRFTRTTASPSPRTGATASLGAGGVNRSSCSLIRCRGRSAALANSPVDAKRRAEVARGLNKDLDKANLFFDKDLVKALETWGTSDNVPGLSQHLEKNGPGNREAVRILGKIRDANAIKAIAKAMNNFAIAGEARNVLKEVGSMAEPAVIEVMAGTNDNRARQDCIRLLGEIGTRNVSGPALQFLAGRFPQDRFLLTTIQQAQAAILARGK